MYKDAYQNNKNAKKRADFLPAVDIQFCNCYNGVTFQKSMIYLISLYFYKSESINGKKSSLHFENFYFS